MSGNGFSTGDLMASMQEAIRKFAAIKRDYLRSQVNLGKCPRCNREPTITNNRCGPTINLCETMFVALRNKLKEGDACRYYSPILDLRLSPYPCDERPRI